MSNKIEKNLNKVFNVNCEDDNKNINVNLEDKKFEITTEVYNYIQELKNRKGELGHLLQKSQGALEVAEEGINDWGKPANIKAFAELISSITKLVKEIKDTDKDINQSNIEKEKTGEGNTYQQNNIFMSSRELLDFLEKNTKKS